LYLSAALNCALGFPFFELLKYVWRQGINAFRARPTRSHTIIHRPRPRVFLPLQISTVTELRPRSTTRGCAFKVRRRRRDLGRLRPLVLAAKYAGFAASHRTLQFKAPLKAYQDQRSGEHDPSPHNNLAHGSLEQWDHGEVPEVGKLFEQISQPLIR
jgi:hypothetical protein